jgi:hypothetical protein
MSYRPTIGGKLREETSGVDRSVKRFRCKSIPIYRFSISLSWLGDLPGRTNSIQPETLMKLNFKNTAPVFAGLAASAMLWHAPAQAQEPAPSKQQRAKAEPAGSSNPTTRQCRIGRIILPT